MIFQRLEESKTSLDEFRKVISDLGAEVIQNTQLKKVVKSIPSESSTIECPIPLVSEDPATAVVATVFVSQLLCKV